MGFDDGSIDKIRMSIFFSSILAVSMWWYDADGYKLPLLTLNNRGVVANAVEVASLLLAAIIYLFLRFSILHRAAFLKRRSHIIGESVSKKRLEQRAERLERVRGAATELSALAVGTHPLNNAIARMDGSFQEKIGELRTINEYLISCAGKDDVAASLNAKAMKQRADIEGIVSSYDDTVSILNGSLSEAEGVIAGYTQGLDDWLASYTKADINDVDASKEEVLVSIDQVFVAGYFPLFVASVSAILCLDIIIDFNRFRWSTLVCSSPHDCYQYFMFWV